jgi:cytochrome c oxidase subunit 3
MGYYKIIIHKDYKDYFSVLLGIYFTIFQAYEYIEASFTIADSKYGSTFFIATGFHGLHVIIGTTFLLTTN